MELRAVKTYYDARHGGLVTLDDDVLSIVRQVRELYGDTISVEMDPPNGTYHFVEHCEDHTDRLIFSTEELDARALERLMMADSTRRGYEDPYDAVEREQDANHKVMDNENLEVIKDVGEHLHHAIHGTGRVVVGMHKPTRRFGAS